MRYERNREDATELVNMGFLKILNNLEKYKESVPFEAWIRRIMINTVIDEYRKKRKELESTDTVDFEDSWVQNQRVNYNEVLEQINADQLEAMLRQLPPISQKVFNLHVIDGYSHKEIGEMLNISDGTSKWHVSFSRKKLKALLAQLMQSEQTSIS